MTKSMQNNDILGLKIQRKTKWKIFYYCSKSIKSKNRKAKTSVRNDNKKIIRWTGHKSNKSGGDWENPIWKSIYFGVYSWTYFPKNSRVGDLKKVFFDRVSKASTTPHKNWAFGSCKKTLDCRRSLSSGGQTGRLRFSELMVKWHVNDRERPRGTHLGLRYNAWNLKVRIVKHFF